MRFPLLHCFFLLLLPRRAQSHSSGAGHCVAPFSYTHGKNAQPGSGGFKLSVSTRRDGQKDTDGGDKLVFRPGDVVTVTVESKKITHAVPFKGLLLYTNHGQFELHNSEVLQFKESCDDSRGKGKTLTHVSNDLKQSVSVDLRLPASLDAAGDGRTAGGLPDGDDDDLGSHVVLNVIVMQELRKWFWLNRTLDGHPPPVYARAEHGGML